MDLFYAHPQSITDNIIILDDFEAKHLLTTLRKKSGDIIDITDGKGHHFTGRISSVKPRLEVVIESRKKIASHKKKIALAISFIRPNRLEFVLEKCTELGVNSFYLFRSEYANYFSDNKQRFEKILRQAIKQSNRFFLPQLYLLSDMKLFIEQTRDINIKIAAVDAQCPPIDKVIQQANEDNKLFCVGPEGGFSPQEIIMLKENNFLDVSLGAYRLRAETAAVAGISFLSMI
jgi:16S rRNA (uracil1498-N3)-methyltransferase